MEELVSVVIPSYNREGTIARAVNSVLKQTYKNTEVIVIDDCSQDNTENIVKSIRDSRLKYFRLKENSGACIARNTGIDFAMGNIIAFQDSDDAWHEEKLAKQLRFLHENKYEFISCSYYRVSNRKKTIIGNKECPSDSQQLYCALLDNNWISTQTVVCYKYCFNKIKFDSKIKRYQDWDIALQAARYFRMGHLNEPLVDVFMQEDSITNVVKGNKEKKKVVEKQYQSILAYNNREVMAQYYKSIADIDRKYDLVSAAKNYKQSLSYNYNLKVHICKLMCITKLMKFYELFRDCR